MVFLHLGFALGFFITKAANPPADEGPVSETVVEAAGKGTRQPLGGKNDEDERKPVPSKFKLRPRTNLASRFVDGFCTFVNRFNNCWLNATMQAVLHLDQVRAKVAPQPTGSLLSLSSLPASSGLFLTALHHPGREFSSSEIFPALAELSERIPSLQLFLQNDITDFVEPLMSWLDDCGVHSRLRVYSVGSCGWCQETSTKTTNFSCICYLPTPCPGDSVTSLFHTMAFETSCDELCDGCLSHLTNEVYFNSPDLMLLNVPRSAPTPQPRQPVTLSYTLLVPVDDGMRTYRLSSVVCHKMLTPGCDHFYTYVFKGGAIVKADDTSVTVEDSSCESDVNSNGIIYFYEKVPQNVRPV